MIHVEDSLERGQHLLVASGIRRAWPREDHLVFCLLGLPSCHQVNMLTDASDSRTSVFKLTSWSRDHQLSRKPPDFWDQIERALWIEQLCIESQNYGTILQRHLPQGPVNALRCGCFIITILVYIVIPYFMSIYVCIFILLVLFL